MTREEIEKYLRMLGEELLKRQLTGEIVIVGGAYMLLVIQNRETTKDVDAYLAVEPQAIREAVRVVADREGLPSDWLNDGVKGFFYTAPSTHLWAEYPGLRIYTATADYVLAMKVIAGRPEDVVDLRALIAHLGIQTAAEALTIVARYVPDRLIPPRAQYLVESLFEDQEEG